MQILNTDINKNINTISRNGSHHCNHNAYFHINTSPEVQTDNAIITKLQDITKLNTVYIYIFF